MKFPLFKPPIHTGKYMADVVCSGWYAPGRQNQLFKEELCNFFRSLDPTPNHFVLGSSATALFQALLMTFRRDSLVTACFMEPTWPGMYTALRATGGGFSSLCPSIIVQTDIGGAALRSVDKKLYPERPWLRDACHSWFKDPLSDYMLLSCYPTKLVPGAEGGVLYCKNLDHALAVDEMVRSGVPALYTSSSHSRLEGFSDPKHEYVRGALKATMPDLLAALNREALEAAPNYISDIAEAWHKLELTAEDLEIPHKPQPLRPYLFQVGVPGTLPSRQSLVAHLTDAGIPTAWNFPPHLWVTLPCFPGMSLNDALEVLGPVKDWMNAQP